MPATFCHDSFCGTYRRSNCGVQLRVDHMDCTVRVSGRLEQRCTHLLWLALNSQFAKHLLSGLQTQHHEVLLNVRSGPQGARGCNGGLPPCQERERITLAQLASTSTGRASWHQDPQNDLNAPQSTAHPLQNLKTITPSKMRPVLRRSGMWFIYQK